MQLHHYDIGLVELANSWMLPCRRTIFDPSSVLFMKAVTMWNCKQLHPSSALSHQSAFLNSAPLRPGFQTKLAFMQDKMYAQCKVSSL